MALMHITLSITLFTVVHALCSGLGEAGRCPLIRLASPVKKQTLAGLTNTFMVAQSQSLNV